MKKSFVTFETCLLDVQRGYRERYTLPGDNERDAGLPQPVRFHQH